MLCEVQLNCLLCIANEQCGYDVHFRRDAGSVDRIIPGWDRYVFEQYVYLSAMFG